MAWILAVFGVGIPIATTPLPKRSLPNALFGGARLYEGAKESGESPHTFAPSRPSSPDYS